MDGDAQFPPITEGEWYQTINGDVFEVIAIDEQDDSIELQYFDGTVEEIDTETWFELVRGPAAAPEDWSGSLDVSREDYDVEGGLRDQRKPGDYIDQS